MKTISEDQIFTRNASRFIAFCYAAGYTMHNLYISQKERIIEVDLFYLEQDVFRTINVQAAVAFWKILNRYNIYQETTDHRNIFGMEPQKLKLA